MKKHNECKECHETDQSKLIVDHGYITNWCRDCKNVYEKERRNKNKEVLVEYKGGECEICEYNRWLTVLCFHHIDPKTKHLNATYVTSWSIKKAKTEIDKCQLLCVNCHILVHHFKEHEDMVPKYFRTTEPFLCKYCNEQDEDKMQMNSGTGNKYRTICKKCTIKEGAQRCRKNKKLLVEHMGGCCAKCDLIEHQSVYEFHHLDSSKKDPNFRNIASWHLDKSKKELENCIMVCGNCHKETHHGI